MALRVWLPLNGDLENKGISDYEIRSANITIVDNGKIGKCYSFNGSSSYISITNFNLSNNWSYGCWINTPNSDSRGWEIAMILNNSGSDADSQFAFWVHQKENRFESLANTQYVSTIPYTNYYNSWHHFFATFNGSLLTTYIDGNIVNTKTITAEYYPATNLTIGARSNNAAGTAFTSWFQGYLNDIRVYDNCLSQKEVKEISQGLVLHYKLDGLGGVGINLLEGNYEVITTSSGNTINGFLSLDQELMPLSALPGKTLTFTYDYSVEGTKANNTGNWNQDRYGIHLSYNYTNGSTTSTAYPGAGYLTISGTGRAVQTFTIPSNITINNFSVGIQPFNRPAENNSNIWYLKNVKLEAGDQDTGWIPHDSNINQISDSSGYNNYASVHDIIFSSENGPRYNVNADFYDNYSAIELQDQWRVVNGEWIQVWSPNIKSQTIAFWWYSSNWQNYASSEYSIPVCNSTNFSIDIANNNIQLNLFATTGYDTNSWNLVPLANLSTGWHYFTLTYSNEQIIFYLDGIQTKTIDVTANNVLDYFLIQNSLLIGNPQIM